MVYDLLFGREISESGLLPASEIRGKLITACAHTRAHRSTRTPAGLTRGSRVSGGRKADAGFHVLTQECVIYAHKKPALS